MWQQATLVDRGAGIPLAVVVSGANRTVMKKLGALLDATLIAMPQQAVADAADKGAARHRCLDRGYDYAACRAEAEAHGYVAHILRRGSTAHPLPPPADPARYPPRRWVVAVSCSWFNRFRRLLICWEKKAANYEGFIEVAVCLIIYRKLRRVRTLSG